MQKLIEKVEIYRFRSIGHEFIKLEPITIFSGANNSGKSNILKALNLFFNKETTLKTPYEYSKDYNKFFRGKMGGVRKAKITVYFYGIGNAALKNNFYIERIFSGPDEIETLYYSTDESVQEKINKKDGNIIRQFNVYLNKFEYLYIPAVRDKIFVKHLFLKFEQIIKKDTQRGKLFIKATKDLDGILQDKSKEISQEFEDFIGLSTKASLSSNQSDILGAISINVSPMYLLKQNDFFVDLFSSGDGILMSYIIYFIAHMSSKIRNKHYIWGFEEPENSLEYSKIQKLAKNFYDNFKKQAQILITTHSPAFIKLKEEENVSFYRVFQDNIKNKIITKVKELNELEKEIQEFSDNKEQYKKLKQEICMVEQALEIEQAVSRLEIEHYKMRQEKEKFEKEVQLMTKNFPEKVFICEDLDKEVVAIWKKLINADSNGITVLSSDGRANNQIEIWLNGQINQKNTYAPKVFRQLDRDGLTDEYLKIIEKYTKEIFKPMKIKHYKALFLPVYEIENFILLIKNKKGTDFPDVDMSLFTHLQKSVGNQLQTIYNKIKNINSVLDDDKKAFEINSNKLIDITSQIAQASMSNKICFYPGKEMIKDNVGKIKDIEVAFKNNTLPKEMQDYLKEISDFFK